MKQFSIAASLILGPILILIALFGIVKFIIVSTDYHAGDMNAAAAFFTFLASIVLIELILLARIAWRVAGSWLGK